jgi:hypothetical protein
MSITIDQVSAALTELYVNRSKRGGVHYVRAILRVFGNGATSLGTLDPAYYENVLLAVTTGGGTPRLKPKPRRVKSPLTLELEARLAARAGKPRSKPTLRVDVGAPAQFGDARDDVAQEFPAGERVR